MSPTAEEVQAFHSFLGGVDWTYEYSDDPSMRRRGRKEQDDLKQQCDEFAWKQRHLHLYQAMRKISQTAWENAGYGKDNRLYYRQAYLNLCAFVDTVDALYKEAFKSTLAYYEKERMATCSDEEYMEVYSIYFELTKQLYEHREKLNDDLFRNFIERYARDYLKLWPDAREDMAPTYMMGVSINYVALPVEIYDAIRKATLSIRKLNCVQPEYMKFLHQVAETANYVFSQEVPEYYEYCRSTGKWGPWFTIQPKYLIKSSVSRSTDCEFSDKVPYKQMNCLPALMVGRLGLAI